MKTLPRAVRAASNTANNAREMTCDTLSRVTQIDHFRDPDADGHLDAGEQPIARFEYAHDQAGNRVQSDEWFDHDANNTLDADEQQTFTYRYDALNRLQTETFAGPSDTNAPTNGDDYVHHYRFDANTNRKSWKKDLGSTNPFTTTYDEEVTYTHDANDRLLTESSTTSGTTTYEFGPNATTGFAGDHTNQTKKTTVNGGTTETHTYTYNEMGRLSGVTITKTGQPTTSETYTYNADGLRVTTTANGTTKTYLFDTTNPTGYAQVLEEKVNGSVTKTYTLGLDVLNHKATTGQLLTLLYDTHGSTRSLLDTAASVVIHNVNGTDHTQIFTYDAYGNSLGFDPTASLTTLLYSGEWTSTLTGDQYLQNRFYRSLTGRFTRIDPYLGSAADPLSYHRYGYVHADPIQGVDPTGEFFTLKGQLSVSGVMNFLVTRTGSALAKAGTAFYRSLWPVFSSQALGITAQATARGFLTLMGRAIITRSIFSFATNWAFFGYPVLMNIPDIIPKLKDLSSEVSPVNSWAAGEIDALASEATNLIDSIPMKSAQAVGGSLVSSSIGYFKTFNAARQGVGIYGAATSLPETIAFGPAGLTVSGGGVQISQLIALAYSGRLDGEDLIQASIDFVRSAKMKDIAGARNAVVDANRWLARFSSATITGSIDLERWNHDVVLLRW